MFKHSGPPAAVIYDLRGNLRDLEHGRRHRSVQRPANMHRLGALVRNVFHGAQAHVGFGAEPILPVLAGEEHDASASLLVVLEELTKLTFGGCRALRIPRELVSADGVVLIHGGRGEVLFRLFQRHQ